MEHTFKGKWISNETLAALTPRNVFHKQLDKVELDCSKYLNEHVLFRRKFNVDGAFSSAKIFISADDYYKLYINGRFVAQGPAPSYHFQYNYNEIDISAFLKEGENLIAVHTLYQGMINRVWQSGDFRHGFICDLDVDGTTVLCSDESFKVKNHEGFTAMGIVGYETQFLERYDSRSRDVGFEGVGFDDSAWKSAALCQNDDHVLVSQKSHMLDFERIGYVKATKDQNRILYDFGSNYVGYLSVKAHGKSGDVIVIRCAQEINEDGRLRYELRANCKYEEEWVLSGGDDTLDWYDYKSFRYAELEISESVVIDEVLFIARHYPFELKTKLKSAFAQNEDLKRVWELCVNTQKYGVQEVIQDCMEREKGFYLGDGCYTALTNMLFTDDDTMVRKLIDDAFSTSFICDTLVTCMDCSFMQEIAEYPLILVSLVLWHYRKMGDLEYLKSNYPKIVRLLEAYRRDYEKEGLLRDLDKWCVVEWPKNFQHDYDADIREGQVCRQAHISINAYYIYAVRMANLIAKEIGLPPYREQAPLTAAFVGAFYNEEMGLFCDSEGSSHASIIGNVFAYGLDLCPNAECKENILKLIDEYGVSSLSLFCSFLILMRFAKDGDDERIKAALSNEGAWMRMLREDATTTFEGWGKDTKWNTSLFHLTMSYAGVFLADVDLKKLFE